MADIPENTDIEDLIRYDVLAQEALLGVVKKVLSEVAQIGSLPGDHHFYITFDTTAAGVQLSDRMKEKYPEEMTIVVQHQYWDLKTTENGFSIGLSFNEIPETLVIPYASIRGFFDPSVQFGLQFDASEQQHEEGKAEVTTLIEADTKEFEPLDPEASDKSDGDASADDEDKSGSADVVSLDAFRKK